MKKRLSWKQTQYLMAGSFAGLMIGVVFRNIVMSFAIGAFVGSLVDLSIYLVKKKKYTNEVKRP